MYHLQHFQVYPDVPKEMAFLEQLLRNLWWSWRLDAIELFRRVNPRLWQEAGRNPIVFSTLISQERLLELSHDDAILAHLRRVQDNFERQVLTTVDHSGSPYGSDGRIAYFSMEFGIHESLPLFAGGLGILAGDHLKAASDLGLPLLGVGLLYRHGYFNQFLTQDGHQQESYPETNLFHLPLARARDPEGKDVKISIQTEEGLVHAAVWRVDVGRVPLFLLDTNLPENSPWARDITSRLYAADRRVRLAQEVLLGIGGIRALEALGVYPTLCHMNEGHCAFLSIERMAQIMRRFHLDAACAKEVVRVTNVFTTHTPVAAGHDEFPPEMVRPYLLGHQEALGMPVDDIIGLGRPHGDTGRGPLSMFVLGLRLSHYCNGVSKLHGETARKMWQHVWPEVSVDEVPISHVTNGIHIPSFISIENAMLFERYIGPEWELRTQDPGAARRIDDIYDEELWRAHEMSRSRLVRMCRRLMVKQYGRRNAPRSVMKEAESVLDQDVMTIAFARRFATYKRAHLLFSDPERLESITNNAGRPVQFIFAGKAHPKDNEGKHLIQRVIEFARRSAMRHRLIFLENYDINIARHLVQGADVWLNTPQRPFEACGTSGMKAAANGVINLSILDGWWVEGYTPERGFAIGSGEELEDRGFQDMVEAQALYNLLENDVIPAFYERTNGGVPGRWLFMMKESMKMAMQHFCSHRMVNEYEQRFYLTAAKRLTRMLEDEGAYARKTAAQRQRLRQLWGHVMVETPRKTAEGPFRVGDSFRVTTKVHLGALNPDEVDVELCHGGLKNVDTLASPGTERMTVQEEIAPGIFLYGCSLTCRDAGRFGFTSRVRPRGELLRHTPGLITWATLG